MEFAKKEENSSYSSKSLNKLHENNIGKFPQLKILLVTNMYPNNADPSLGVFVMQQVQQIQRLGHSVDVLNIHGYRSKLNYLKAAFDVFLQTWRKRYDVVHAHYGLSGFPALFRWRTPLVITIHGSDALVGRVEPLISRLVSWYADEVIVVSKKIASIIPGEIIPCGIDLEVFKPQDREDARALLGLPKNKRFILFPFNPQRRLKRYDLAKAVVDRLALRGQNVGLLVAFGVENSKMPLYYNAADVMILCSNSEGSPTSVKEALACNTPVVCTNVGDVSDILEGVPGVEICDQDVEALAECIEHVFTRKLSFEFDGRSAMKRYDQYRTAKSVIKVYERTLRNSDRSKRII